VDSSQNTSLLVYGQRQVVESDSSSGPNKSTLKLCVARRKLPPPPPSVRKVRPGDPLPRGTSSFCSHMSSLTIQHPSSSHPGHSRRNSLIVHCHVQPLQHQYTPLRSSSIPSPPLYRSFVHILWARHLLLLSSHLHLYQVVRQEGGVRNGRDRKQRRMRRDARAARSWLTETDLKPVNEMRMGMGMGTRIYLGNVLLPKLPVLSYNQLTSPSWARQAMVRIKVKNSHPRPKSDRGYLNRSWIIKL